MQVFFFKNLNCVDFVIFQLNIIIGFSVDIYIYSYYELNSIDTCMYPKIIDLEFKSPTTSCMLEYLLKTEKILYIYTRLILIWITIIYYWLGVIDQQKIVFFLREKKTENVCLNGHWTVSTLTLTLSSCLNSAYYSLGFWCDCEWSSPCN